MIVLPTPVSRLRELRPLVTRNEQHVGLYAYSIDMKATHRHCTHEVLQGARARDGFTGATQKSPHVHTPDTPRMVHSKACRMHGWHTQGLRVRIRGIPVSGCLGSPPLTVAAFIAVIAAIVAIAVGAAAITA